MEGMVIDDGSDKQEKENFRHFFCKTKPENEFTLTI